MIKAILRLIDGTTGSIRLDGQDRVSLNGVNGRHPPAFVPFRRKIAAVQQDFALAFFEPGNSRDSFRQIGGGPRKSRAAWIAPASRRTSRWWGSRNSPLDALPRFPVLWEIEADRYRRALGGKTRRSFSSTSHSPT